MSKASESASGSGRIVTPAKLTATLRVKNASPIRPTHAGVVARRRERTRRSAMKWLTEFYNERRGVLARYGIDALLPAEAVLLGWKAVLAEYPSTPRRGPLSLFERAQRVGGQDASGWVLYRIVRDSGHGSPDVARAPAA